MSNLDIMWEKTLEILGKVNAWIPLWAVLLSGLILVGVVLILAICSCALRKTLVPNWLIWIYFIFATIVIFAHTGNDVAGWVAAMEVPVLVVLLCYLLRIVFRRRARYVYVEKEVYARRLAKGQVYQIAADGQQIVTVKKHKKEKPARGVKKETKLVEVIETTETEVVDEEKVNREKIEREKAEKEKAEMERAEREAEAARIAAAEKAAREAREKEKAAIEKAAKTEATRSVTVTRPASTTTSTFTTIDLPTVNPIPDKTYEPAREPMIVANPVSKTMPDLKIPTAPVQLRSSSTTTSRPATRPATSNTTPVTRPATSVSRPTTTTTSTTTNSGNNAFVSMYSPRVVKTTTTTTNTTTSNNTNTVEAVSASRTVNGNTTSATAVKATSSSSGTAPHSTEDIMAAIERLRASMKK